MNQRAILHRAGLAALSAALCAFLCGSTPAQAGPAGRPPLARSSSEPGTLVVCPGQDKPCRVVEANGNLAAGDLLIALPGLQATVDAVKGGVRLTLLGSLPESPNDPPRDTAVRLKQNAAVALDLTLERGRILLTRLAKKGAVKVRVQMVEGSLNLELTEPDTVVALELYSRWPAGTPFLKEPKKDREPETDALLFLLKGELSVQVGKEPEETLKGKVVYHWNNLRGVVGPLPAKELPVWTSVPPVPAEKPLRLALAEFRKRLAKMDLAAVLAQAGQSADPLDGALAAYAAGALDDVRGLLKALEAKQPRVRKAAVQAAQHWSGRSAAHDVRLYEGLIASGYKSGHAEIAMALLHGFDAAALAQPATYALLIDYLGHDRLAVRELAAGHLYRLAPVGRKIAYDAAGSPEQHAQAQAAWRKRIPRGTVPEAP